MKLCVVSEAPVNIEVVDLLQVLKVEDISDSIDFILIPIIKGLSKVIDAVLERDSCFVMCKIQMYHPDFSMTSYYLCIEPYKRKACFYISMISRETTTGVTEANKQMAVLCAMQMIKMWYHKFCFDSMEDVLWINNEYTELLDSYMTADSCGVGCLEGADDGDVNIQLSDDEWTELFETLKIEPEEYI